MRTINIRQAVIKMTGSITDRAIEEDDGRSPPAFCALVLSIPCSLSIIVINRSFIRINATIATSAKMKLGKFETMFSISASVMIVYSLVIVGTSLSLSCLVPISVRIVARSLAIISAKWVSAYPSDSARFYNG